MHLSTRTRAKAVLLALCGAAGLAFCASVQAAQEPPHPQALDDAIVAAAKRHGVPEHLVRRIIMRESKYNPKARNRLYWGLMQISYPTAKSMGFKGTPQELLNPVVNLRYAVPYLANAFVIAGKREDSAVRLYAAGYYFTARTRGLLAALRTADSTPLNGFPDDPQPALAANAAAQSPQSVGVFGALFGPGSQPQPQPATYTADASAAGQSQPQPTPGQGLVATSAGTFNGPTVAMIADKKGALAPPKKWTRDGGTTVIARGEQGLEKVASRTAADEDGKTHRRSRKITTFAALDLASSSAQAYSAPQAQDPRFAAAASQAAIAQATSGQAPTGQPVVAAGQPAATQQVAGTTPQAEPTAAADDERPSKRKRSRHARHRHKSGSGTQVAESKATTDEPTPALRPTAAQ